MAGNAARGLTNHQSTIFLFDADTGRCRAAVGGNLLSALRTAAAAAVSIKHLARPDVAVLGTVGAGHHSALQLEAALTQRDFSRMVAWNRDPAKLDRLRNIAERRGFGFAAVDLDALGAEADAIDRRGAARRARGSSGTRRDRGTGGGGRRCDHAGRASPDEITLFDGTGVGLQDPAVAVAIVELADARGGAIEVDL